MTIGTRTAADRVHLESLILETRTSKSCHYCYENQCWVVDGRVKNCGHPERMAEECELTCYGRQRAGEIHKPCAGCH